MAPRRNTRGSFEPESSDPNVDLLKGTLEALVTALRATPQGGNSSGGASSQGSQAGGPGTALERFRKLQPPSFSGGNAPKKAEDWMLDLEKFFTALNLADDEKVNLAAFQLTREASRWYTGLSQRETQPVTWARFVEHFEEEYFPATWKEKRYDEFMNLRQGSMTVSEYRTKFSQLLRFAKGIFPEEEMLRKKFENVLRDNF